METSFLKNRFLTHFALLSSALSHFTATGQSGRHLKEHVAMSDHAMIEIRLEKDTFGEIAVPRARFWGAQTQRSLQNFKISSEKQPPARVHFEDEVALFRMDSH